MRWLVLFVLWATPLSAEAFWLRNTDASAVFCWWAVPFTANPGAALGAASADPGSVHRVAPGERVRIELPEGRDLLGLFVAWDQALTPTSPSPGGWIRATEAPASGTVSVDVPSWNASNRGRTVAATLQEWGLEPPLLALSLQATAWTSVVPLAEWGPSFVRSAVRPNALQVLARDGALWLRLTYATIPAGTTASLVLRKGTSALEWPVQTGPLWAWSGEQARAVGRVLAAPGVLVGWLPLDRLSAAERAVWTQGEWSWAVVTEKETQSFNLGSFDGEDVP